MQNGDSISVDDKNIDISKVSLMRNSRDGKGVYANQDIDKDNIIETFPVMPLQYRTQYMHDMSILSHCFCSTSCQCQECQKHGHVLYLAGGYGMFYKPSSVENINATFKMNYPSFYGQVIATKNIAAGEEICVGLQEFYMYQIINQQKDRVAANENRS